MATDFRFAAFAGRRRELAVLLEFVRGLGSGRGAIVLIDGAYGVGKTRLIQQFVLELGSGAEAFNMGAIPLLEFGRWPADDRTVREVPHLDASAVESRIGRKTVFVFDDIGRASKSLLRTLERVAHLALVNPWVVVAAYETNFVDGARNGVARLLLRLISLGAVELSLEPLVAADMRLLLQSSTHAAPLERDHLEYVLRTAQGNPMYASELLRHTDARTGATRPLLTLADAIGRVSELDANARDVLNAASVLGARFDGETLRQMVKLPADLFASILDRLAALRTIEPDAQKSSYKFCSNVDRTAIYEALLPAHRRLLHAAALDALAAAADASEVDLAWHAFEAQVAESAAYLARAAQAEQRRGRFDETLRLLRAGLSVATGEDRAHFVQSLVTAMYMGASGYRSIEKLLEESHGDVTPALTEDLATALERKLWGRIVDCDGEGARRVADEALETLIGAPSSFVRVRIVIARALAVLDRHDDARAVLAGADPPDASDPVANARYCWALALASRPHNDHVACLERFGDVIPALWELQPFAALTCIGTLASLYYRYGDVNQAWNVLEHGLEMNRSLGERAASLEWTALTAAEIALLRGNAVAAREALGPVLETAEFGAFMRADLAANALSVGVALQDELLLNSFDDEAMLDAALRSGSSDLIGHVVHGFCELYAFRGQTSKLRAVISRALDASAIVDQCYHLAVYAARYGSTADVARASALIAESPWRMPLALAHVRLFRAIVASRNGQRTEALRLSRRAREGYERAGWQAFARIAQSVTDGKRAKAGETPQSRLTAREAEIARLAAQGMGNDEIAATLSISTKTVSNHLMAAFAKLDVHSRRELKYLLDT